MRITLRRRSISRLQQESWAISWRDITAADTQRQIHMQYIWYSSLLLPDEGWDYSGGADCCVVAFKTTFTGLTSGLRLYTTSREGAKDNVGERKKKRNTALDEHRNIEKGWQKREKASHHPPLHFQTLIYNFNISNFHSSAHFPNVIFQFMSNRVTIFLNTAYDKLGGKADMQFRLSVLQAQQQTH